MCAEDGLDRGLEPAALKDAESERQEPHPKLTGKRVSAGNRLIFSFVLFELWRAEKGTYLQPSQALVDRRSDHMHVATRSRSR